MTSTAFAAEMQPDPVPSVRADVLASECTSVCLDLLRTAAALAVFLQHGNLLGLDGGALRWFQGGVGHSAVVFFFVLSGYVIAASTAGTGSAREFVVKRVARIASVAVPAVLLALLVDLAMLHWEHIPPEAAYQLRRPWAYFALALTFAGDCWWLAEPAFGNVPYWSLNYEVWYYILFGAAVFAQGAWRWGAVLLVLALMGPKLWLLLPVWLAGVAAYRLHRSRLLPRWPARLLVAVAFGLLLALKALGWEAEVNAAVPGMVADALGFPLRYSQWFVGDYLVGGLALGLVYGLGGAGFVVPRPLRQPIVDLAGLSFGLYLAHYPLLRLFGALLPEHGWAAMLLALGGALAFAAVFEPQKLRLRRRLERLSTARAGATTLAPHAEPRSPRAAAAIRGTTNS